jgi:hypothetical protein
VSRKVPLAWRTPFGYDVEKRGIPGDGSDQTAALQALVTELNAISGTLIAEGQRPGLLFGDGTWVTGTLTSSKPIAIHMGNELSSAIKLKAGTATSLFVFNCSDIGGTSLDDDTPYYITGGKLIGNRTNLVKAASHAVECPDAPVPLATQYLPSVVMEDVQIQSFTGDGVHLGVNRNAARLSGCWVRYCNGSGFASYGYDHQIVGGAFGNCEEYSIRSYGGGACTVMGAAIFFSTAGVVINSSTDQPWEFTNCSFDGHLQYGAYVAIAGYVEHSFVACRFTNNSRSAANTYSDIIVDGTGAASDAAWVNVSGCQFKFLGQKSKYLVEVINGARARFSGNLYNSAGGANTPYGTDVVNDYVAVDFAGAAVLGAGRRFIGEYNWASLPSAVAWSGFGAFVKDKGENGIAVRSTGSYWMPTHRQALATSYVAASCGADTTEDVLATITVPASMMGIKGGVIITTLWSCTNNANTKTARIRFGGIGGTAFQGIALASAASGRLACEIRNRSVTNSQVGPSTGNPGFGTGGSTITTAAVDTTADVSIVISGQKGTAGDTLTLEGYTVEIVP